MTTVATVKQDRHRVFPGGTPSGDLRQISVAAGLIVLGPVVVVLLLRLPLINQLNYADAWFYSSYAWAPKHDLAIFGWNYFAARFSLVLPIGLFSRAFGVHTGYILLRYLLALSCGLSVYMCVRRFASVHVAAAAAALLYLQPFFTRSLLWDYTFIEIAGGVVGVGLWYWTDERHLAWTLLPGVALAASAFANANIAIAILALLIVEVVGALRRGRRAALYCSARLSLLVASVLIVFLAGYLGYVAILGGFDPYDLIRPTINFLRENSKNSAPYVRPPHLWLLHEPRLWMPIITSVALVSTMRDRILDVTIPARMAQLCICLTGLLWLYRFSVTSSVLEVWWSYDIVVIATAPAMGVLLHELTRSAHRPLQWTYGAVGGFAVAAVVIRSGSTSIDDIYSTISTHRSLLLGLLAAGILAALLISQRNSAARLFAVSVFLLILAIMSYAPSVLDGRGTTGIFVTDGAEEWRTYAGGERLIKIIQNYDAPSHRVFLWWPETLGPVSIAWSDLPQRGDTLNLLGASESIDQLSPLGHARITEPSVKYVMILAPRPSELDAANRALAAAGVHWALVERGDLADGALHYSLIELAGK